MTEVKREFVLKLEEIETDSLFVLLEKLKDKWNLTKNQFINHMTHCNNQRIIEELKTYCNRKINAYLSIMVKIENARDYSLSTSYLISLNEVEIIELMEVFHCYQNSNMNVITKKVFNNLIRNLKQCYLGIAEEYHHII